MSRPVDPTLRTRLLEAATAEFAAHGFARATMAGIGRRAGVTKGGVYFHFRSKEALFFAALDHGRAGLRAAFGAAIEHRGSAAARLRAFLGACFRFHFDHPDAARLMRVLVAELRDRFTAELREDAPHDLRALRAQVRELLTQGVRDGSLFTEDPVYAAFLIAGSVHGVLDQWLTAPADAQAFCDADDLAEALVAPFATGVRAAPAGLEVAADEAAGRDFAPPF